MSVPNHTHYLELSKAIWAKDYLYPIGTGLGDILNNLWYRNAYNVITELRPEDRMRIVLLSHNPFVWELFKWHPKFNQLDVLLNEPVQTSRIVRESFQLPCPSFNGAMKRTEYGWKNQDGPSGDPVFYPSPSEMKDETTLWVEDELPENYILVAASSSSPLDAVEEYESRNLPSVIIYEICSLLKEHGLTPVLIGRNYKNRKERNFRWANSLIDKLTIPATLSLMQKAKGLVTGHSSLNIAAYHMRMPQLLLYPQNTLKEHFMEQTTQWSFGRNFEECVHTSYQEFTREHVARFVKVLRVKNQPVLAQ